MAIDHDWFAAIGARRVAYYEPSPTRVLAVAWLRNTAIVAAGAFVFFLLFPKIDLAITLPFYAGDNYFVGNWMAPYVQLRWLFNAVFYGVCGLCLAGLMVTAFAAATWIGFDFRKWLFLAVCLLTGPLVVANIGLKDHWGRARPRDVIEFGGAHAYTPPFPAANQCQYNCSFVSGEASSIYVVFFAAAFLLPAYSRALAAAGIAFGGLAGFTRITQGGHFLSDVIFAGLFMALTVAILALLFDTLSEPERRLQPSARASTIA